MSRSCAHEFCSWPVIMRFQRLCKVRLVGASQKVVRHRLTRQWSSLQLYFPSFGHSLQGFAARDLRFWDSDVPFCTIFRVKFFASMLLCTLLSRIIRCVSRSSTAAREFSLPSECISRQPSQTRQPLSGTVVSKYTPTNSKSSHSHRIVIS